MSYLSMCVNGKEYQAYLRHKKVEKGEEEGLTCSSSSPPPQQNKEDEDEVVVVKLIGEE